MTDLFQDAYLAFAAWPFRPATPAELATHTLRTLQAISATAPVPIAWHVTGETEPLALDEATLERIVEAGVWRSDPDENGATFTDPRRGFHVSFVGRRTDVPEGTWVEAIALSLDVGKSGAEFPRDRAPMVWPNSITATVDGPVPDAAGRAWAAYVLRVLVAEWPASWGAVRSDDILDAVPPARQPETFVGYSTWIAQQHAPVPETVPHASRTPVENGVWLELAVPADAAPDAALVAATDAALRGAGSLRPIPAFA